MHDVIAQLNGGIRRLCIMKLSRSCAHTGAELLKCSARSEVNLCEVVLPRRVSTDLRILKSCKAVVLSKSAAAAYTRLFLLSLTWKTHRYVSLTWDGIASGQA